MAKAIILVVEDEPVQRIALVDIVAEAGFEPLEAANADLAVAILEARLDIRVVFTDIDMPGSMDGLKLAASVRDRWPPIDIILTTAGRPPPMDKLPVRSVFLPKPIRVKDAIAALRSLAA
jgi:DNA-binding NtrC family response regulator